MVRKTLLISSVSLSPGTIRVSMPHQFLTIQRADRIATVTIAHPPVNVLSAAVVKELDVVFGELEADDSVRTVVLTASGRYFSPGADIKELNQVSTAYQGTELSARGQALLNRIERFDKPVIAAINGVCLGGGLELAMACHIRVCAAEAQFGLPEVNLGMIPGFGGTQRLPRIIGPSKAAELILTGESITADEALALGLVNRVVAAGEVVKQAQLLAGMTTTKGRLAIQSALRAIRCGLDSPLAEGLAREAELFGELCETADKQEGLRAFLEKRQPHFKDQ
jgi:enoyl-CoA hydratase